MPKGYQASTVLAIAALWAAEPASACRVGGTQHLFEDAPDVGDEDVDVLYVQFSNQNEAFRDWQARKPSEDLYSLIGVARITDPQFTEIASWFPVYAFVTSCTAFWGSPPQSVETNAYVVGRFERAARNDRAFIAYDKRWGVDEETRFTR
jgi:hypothetical protein